jgi:hypothetical protein
MGDAADEEHELRTAQMRAGIANEEADTACKHGLLRYEPWKVIALAKGVGAGAMAVAVALIHLAGGLNPFGLRRAISMRVPWTGASESSYSARCTNDRAGASAGPGLGAISVALKHCRECGGMVSTGARTCLKSGMCACCSAGSGICRRTH